MSEDWTDEELEAAVTAYMEMTRLEAEHTQRCSSGLANEFGVEDDEAERGRLYAFWRDRSGGKPDIDPSAPLSQRAAKFASVEVRPAQAAFRRLVFEAYGGRCAISGCDVPEALDAAHRNGRDWRRGHNRAEDGILLRKDLHALYDAGLLAITDDGKVVCHAAHYAPINGTALTPAADHERAGPLAYPNPPSP